MTTTSSTPSIDWRAFIPSDEEESVADQGLAQNLTSPSHTYAMPQGQARRQLQRPGSTMPSVRFGPIDARSGKGERQAPGSSVGIRWSRTRAPG